MEQQQQQQQQQFRETDEERLVIAMLLQIASSPPAPDQQSTTVTLPKHENWPSLDEWWRPCVTDLTARAQQLKIDGLSQMARTTNRPVARAIWLLLLLASLGTCAWLVATSIGAFLTYELTLTTRLLPDRNVPFPVVTFCSLTHFSFYNASGAAYILELEAYAKNTTGAYLSDAQKQRLGPDMRSMLVQCSLSDVTVTTTAAADCYAAADDDFEWMWHPRLRLNCYRFNAHGRFRVNMPGRRNFRLNVALYAGGHSSELQAKERGFYLFVQNQTDFPLDDGSEAILISPGIGAHVRVDRAFYSQDTNVWWPHTSSSDGECRVDERDQLMGHHKDLNFTRYCSLLKQV